MLYRGCGEKIDGIARVNKVIINLTNTWKSTLFLSSHIHIIEMSNDRVLYHTAAEKNEQTI